MADKKVKEEETMECFHCGETFPIKKYKCPNCGMAYKEEVERGLKCIGIDYSKESTKKVMETLEQV